MYLNSFLPPATPLTQCRVQLSLTTLAMAFLILTSSTLSSTASAAAGFNIQPLLLKMSARQRSNSLELTNLTNTDIPVQIKAYRWTQENGQDVFTPTRDIFLAPPITNVKAAAKQIVRFRLKKGADVNKENSYRIFVEQIPPADPALRASMEFRIRFSVPLFVAPIRFSDPSFTVKAQNTKDGVRVVLDNRGNIHVKVKGVAAYGSDTDINNVQPNSALANVGSSTTGNGYALPDTTQEWLIPLPSGVATDDKLKVAISTDYFNSSGRGPVKSSGLMWAIVDGPAVNSDAP